MQKPTVLLDSLPWHDTNDAASIMVTKHEDDSMDFEWMGDDNHVLFSRELYETMDWSLVPWELIPVACNNHTVLLRRIDGGVQ